jgi:hypothetical protein
VSGDVVTAPRYPRATVKLIGEDGNAFAILGLVDRALKSAGVGFDERSAFIKEATSAGSYDGLLQVVMEWVKVR